MGTLVSVNWRALSPIVTNAAVVLPAGIYYIIVPMDIAVQLASLMLVPLQETVHDISEAML